MAQARGQTGKVNFTGAASADRRSGGISPEFARSRNVNKFSGKGSTTASKHSNVSSRSARREPPFNGSNVYGITATPGSKNNSGSGPYGSGRGNSIFGSGSARSASGARNTKGRTGRRGGR